MFGSKCHSDSRAQIKDTVKNAVCTLRAFYIVQKYVSIIRVRWVCSLLCIWQGLVCMYSMALGAFKASSKDECESRSYMYVVSVASM